MIPLVAAVAAGIAGLVGWLWWRGDGELRAGSGEVIRPHEVALPDDAFGAVATLLLLTSQQDERGPAERRILDDLAAGHPGVRVAEVDLTVRGALAGRYGVTRTPTLLVLDADARLRARVKGAGDEATLRRALDAALRAG